MFQSLEVFRLAHGMAVHAGQRQALISQNVANADTPGYVARDIPSFQETVTHDPARAQKATRSRHLNGSNPNTPLVSPFEDRQFASLDGNTVSVEKEMLRAVETKRQHDRSLAIYRSALDVLRQTVSTR